MLKRFFTLALTLFCMLLGLTACSGDLFRRRQFFGMSEHFANGKFVNEEIPATAKVMNSKNLAFAGHMLFKNDWPADFVTPQKKVLKIREEGLRVYFVNHATCLIQIENLNILTDPVWSKRVSPFSGIGPKRVTNPGIKFEDLPPIDIVLISHDHYDHLDIDTVVKLNKKFAPKFFVGLGVEKLLKRRGIENVCSMDWWDSSLAKPGLNVTFVPSQHFSGRGLFDRNSTLWGGFVVSGQNSRVYFAGDTGYSAKQFSDIKAKFENLDVAILPIGAYEPREMMKEVHMNPRDAVLAHRILNPKRSIPIHYATFRLSLEKYEAPPQDLQKALDELGVSRDKFQILEFGESVLIK
jgi:N-acyl-phosphatidylethanolamine-hydrolysing phospholipase D